MPNDYEAVREQLVEQKITQQVTITAGSSKQIEVDVPDGKIVYLKGYGYSYYTDNKYHLSTGNMTFPERQDQEGSPSIPMIFGNPFKVRSGGKLRLTIENGDTSSHTYDIVFYILTNEFLDIISKGGELLLATSSGSGTGSSLSIWNSTFTAVAPVDTVLGLAVNPISPQTLVAGSKASVDASAIVLGASAGVSKLTLQASITNATSILVGNATLQPIELQAGQSIDLTISNVNKVYIKRSGGSNVTMNFIGG